MPKRSRPYKKYFLTLMTIYVIMAIGIEVQLWIEKPCLMSGASVSVEGISGDKEALEVILQNQEMIPGYMREYVQGVASYKAGKILENTFQFMKIWVFAGLTLNLIVGIIILLWARDLYKRIYLDAVEVRRKGSR